MKFTVLFAAAVLAGTFSTRAVTQNAATADTNTNPEAAMTALFGNPAIVKGKGFEIKRGDLDQVVTAARSNYRLGNQMPPADLEITVLNQLIAIQVLQQTSTPADLAVGKVDADRQYTNLLAQFRSQEAFETLLKARGMTADELKAKALQEAVAKAALKRGLGINISDDDARKFYTDHAADFEQPEMVHARHLLLMTIDPATHMPLTTNTVAAKRKQIEDLRKRILAGEDFGTLARQYSDDPGSKENGGELPNFARGQMLPEFESAAFALGTNQVSEIVTTMYGFHLIKVLEKIPAKKIEFATAADEIKEELAQRQIHKLAPAYIRKLRTDEQVEILDASLKSQDEQMEAAAAAAAATEPPSTNL
ncbi:MAG: peptidylprolyl isomerase [Verrucomicrobiae bacterium]|jgi:parvulin-like peptidyl-prolyl isomerase|nr:peptidylprolyl isomerase [Verrucomicrobiae bacterium]